MEWDYVLFLRWAHVIGACVLLGTGAGIAFFMLMAHRTRNPLIIAHTTGVVVLADWLFTATSVLLQPITGFLLAHALGWSFDALWLWLSLILYVVVGVFWLPVIWIQYQLKRVAHEALHKNIPLSSTYERLFRIWFACGIPAFLAVLAIVWLMLARPV